MKVISLCRVSTQEQAADDRAGIARQRAEIARAAQLWELQIVRELSLSDVSGSEVLLTPEYEQLRRDLRRPEIAGVVVADLDRLYRPDRFSDLALLDDFKDHDKKIFTPEQVIEPSTQSGFLVGGITSIIAGHDRMQIKRRMLGAKEVKRREGKCPNSWITLPTGVAWDKQSERFHYTEKAQVVRHAFELVAAGVTNLHEVERMTGIHHRTLANVLRNPIYRGIRAYVFKRGPEKYPSRFGRQADRKKVARSSDELIAVRVIKEPLVSDELFETVQRALSEKKRAWQQQRRRRPNRFGYVGLVYCDACGRNCYTVSGELHGRRDYYACIGRVRGGCNLQTGERRYMLRAEVDSTIDGLVSEQFTSESFLSSLLTQHRPDALDDESQKAVFELTEKIKALRKRRKNLLGLYADELIPREDLDEQVTKINQELEATERACQDEVKKQALCNGGGMQRISRDLCTVFAEFPFLQASEKRRLLLKLMPKIYLRSGAVTKVELRVPIQEVGIRTGRDSWRRPA